MLHRDVIRYILIFIFIMICYYWSVIANSKQQVQQMSPAGPIIGVIVALCATLAIVAVIVICIIW